MRLFNIKRVSTDKSGMSLRNRMLLLCRKLTIDKMVGFKMRLSPALNKIRNLMLNKFNLRIDRR